jgi:hypothetical protein
MAEGNQVNEPKPIPIEKLLEDCRRLREVAQWERQNAGDYVENLRESLADLMETANRIGRLNPGASGFPMHGA